MNDNFSFYLNNFQNLEKSFRNKLKEIFEDGKVDEMNLRSEEIISLNNKLTEAKQKLEEFKSHYGTNFRNNNEISRKISIIEDNISNYCMLQEYFNIKIQKENFVEDLLEKNSLKEISKLISPTKRIIQTPKDSINKINNKIYSKDNTNELTALLKKEIDRQDDLITDFNEISKSIKRSNLEVQNELVKQNQLLKKFEKDVSKTTIKVEKSESKFDEILIRTSKWKLSLFIFFEILIVVLIVLYL